MFRKTCQNCGHEFETPNRNYYLCRECFYAAIGEATPVKCAAIKASGNQCRNWAKDGRKYCHAHWQLELFALVNTPIALAGEDQSGGNG